MTGPELMTVVATLAGAWFGGSFGYQGFGWIGAIAGVPIGAIAGVSVRVAGGELLSRCIDGVGLFLTRRPLHRYFGRYWSRERAEDWALIVGLLKPGDELDGTVVHYFTDVLIVDVGHGFPALISAIGQYRKGLGLRNWPKIGATIRAQIVAFDHTDRYILIKHISPPEDETLTTDSMPR
jgi:hypothetical protein